MEEEINIPVIQEPNEQSIETEQEAIEIAKVTAGVESVNGKDGVVVLTAQDVGALPSDTFIPTTTSELDNDAGFVTENDIPTATSQLYNDSGYITAASVPKKTSQLTNDSGFVSSSELAEVATTGSYADLSNKPTIPTVNNATLTIQKNGTNVATFTSNSSTNQTANITVPTTVASLSDASDYAKKTAVAKDIGDEKTARENADGELQTAITNEATTRGNADTTLGGYIDTINSAINKNVMTDLVVDANASTTVVQLDATKTNIKTSSTTTSNIPLPVASSTQAGVLNSATFDAISQNTSDIEALTNGAVAITGLGANPTQAELTTAWENATGLSTLMNRAGIYDVTNTKYWTYYTNDTTWHYTTGAAQVTINTFTNSSEGTILGSTTAGQVFAENDGTGSVNGWDSLTSTVSDHTSKLATIAQGAEVNVQSDWSEADNTADSYIKNKPNLATVATSGSYNDLSGTPTLATVATSGAYNDLSGTPNLATVATSGSYTDLTNQPTVPTTVAQLTDSNNYYTSSQTDAAIAAAIDNITDFDGESF